MVDRRLNIAVIVTLVLLAAALLWRAFHPRPFWRYQSMTALNATAADMEQSMRSALGSDHAEFTRLGSSQLGVTSFGRTPQDAMTLSARLEEDASIDFRRRGLGRIISTASDVGAYSDGDPDEFSLWRLHYITRNLGFPSWHHLVVPPE